LTTERHEMTPETRPGRSLICLNTIQLRDPHELELKIKSAYLQSKTITNIGFKLKPNYIFHKIYDIARGDKLGSSKYSNSSSTDGGIFGNCL